MDKIVEFAGKKTISIMSRDECNVLMNLFPDDDFVCVTIHTKRDLNLAIKSGAKIYAQEVTTPDKTKFTRYFVRVNRERLFSIAFT